MISRPHLDSVALGNNVVISYFDLSFVVMLLWTLSYCLHIHISLLSKSQYVVYMETTVRCEIILSTFCTAMWIIWVDILCYLSSEILKAYLCARISGYGPPSTWQQSSLFYSLCCKFGSFMHWRRTYTIAIQVSYSSVIFLVLPIIVLHEYYNLKSTILCWLTVILLFN